jgi:hypothetical protein
MSCQVKSAGMILWNPVVPLAWPAAEFWQRYDKGEFK